MRKALVVVLALAAVTAAPAEAHHDRKGTFICPGHKAQGDGSVTAIVKGQDWLVRRVTCKTGKKVFKTYTDRYYEARDRAEAEGRDTRNVAVASPFGYRCTEGKLHKRQKDMITCRKGKRFVHFWVPVRVTSETNG